MSSLKGTGFVLQAAIAAACLLLAAGVRAQDTSTSSSAQTGQPTVTTDVTSATVVYVSGNDLVVKMSDGQVKNLVVPDDRTVNVDGKELNVHDLRPGMRLTRTITTTTTPHTVKTVTTIKGKVFFPQPPDYVILTLPDGKNKRYNIPKGQMFDINGQQVDAFGLRKGMVISATVVTEAPETVAKMATTVTGTPAPAPPPPATPPPQQVLLIAVPVSSPAPQPQAQQPEAQPTVAQNLPKTGSYLPLIALAGAMMVGLAALRLVSRS